MSRLCLTCRRPDPKPSKAQRVLLERFAAGAEVVYVKLPHTFGEVATLDGKQLYGTWYALKANGWLDHAGKLMTPAGRAALERWPS